MNQRIKQLLHESIDNCDGTMTDRTHSLKSSELQKFAELIVRECAYLIDDVLEEGSPPTPTLGEQLVAQFGVDE